MLRTRHYPSAQHFCVTPLAVAYGRQAQGIWSQIIFCIFLSFFGKNNVVVMNSQLLHCNDREKKSIKNNIIIICFLLLSGLPVKSFQIGIKEEAMNA